MSTWLLKGLEELVDDIDNRSMGTNSICSLYEYGQISSDDELKELWQWKGSWFNLSSTRS